MVVLAAWGADRKFSHAKTSISRLEEVFVPSNAETLTQGHINNEESIKHGTTKGTNKALVTASKEMQIYNVPVKDCKIIILRKLTEDFPGEQWIRTHLPMQGTQVPSLFGEDSTCPGAAKPIHHKN